MTSSQRRFGRLLAVLAVLAALSSSLHATSVRAQGDEEQLDLASIILTTADLEDAGLEDYVIRGASPYTLEDDAFFISGGHELDEDEVAEGLEDADYVGSYVLSQHIPADPETPGGESEHRLATRVYAFEDANGAEDGYAIITDESELSEASEDEPVDLGDEAELTELEFGEGNFTHGAPYEQIELEILLGRLVLEVSATAFEGASGDAVDADTVTALGERLVERAEAALDGDVTSLLPAMLRLDTGITIAPFVTYELLDGDPIRNTFETEDEFASRVERDEEAGVVSVLIREEFLTEPTEVNAAIRFINLGILLEDEDAAAAYVAEAVERFEDIGGYTSVEEIEADTIGDSSLIVELTYEGEDGPVVLRELFVQVGAVVHVIWVERDFPAPALEAGEDALIELGEAQVECAEDESCTEPIPVPDALNDLLDNRDRPQEDEEAEEDNVPADEEDEEAPSDEDEDAPADDEPSDDEDEEAGLTRVIA